jgi:hypothetical protein
LEVKPRIRGTRKKYITSIRLLGWDADQRGGTLMYYVLRDISNIKVNFLEGKKKESLSHGFLKVARRCHCGDVLCRSNPLFDEETASPPAGTGDNRS